MAKRKKQKTFSVYVRGETSEIYENIEADNIDEAEKKALEMFSDYYGTSLFHDIKAEADEND